MRSPFPFCRAALWNSLAALLSVAIAVAACEVALRLLHPRYELAARPPSPQPERPERTYHLVRDPDTGTAHRVYFNNLGGRQSRSFATSSLDGAVNIAFFGDSQTENLRMPAQYSFTEPLDFLLNLGAADPAVATRPPLRFNVLNFGVTRYGPAQAYLHWRHLPARRKLAHVFYMLVSNDHGDLRRALRAGIVRIAGSGEIVRGGPPATPAWKLLLGRLHLTYLAVDAWQRLADWPAADVAPVDTAWPGGSDFSTDELLLVFGQLLRRWKREVEADGGRFHLVLLPDPADSARWQDIRHWGLGEEPTWVGRLREDAALGAEVGYFDMRACFDDAVPGFTYRDWSFTEDLHWNAAANMVAATCLYRRLEEALALPERTDDELAGARHAYYRAFLDSPAWEGQRYMPDAAWARPEGRRQAVRGRGETIVAKYLALELAAVPVPAWLRDAYEAGPAATSVWDVYVDVPGRRLVYVKAPCAPNERAPGRGFFVHATPFTREKLPPDRIPAGFLNLDPRFTYVRSEDAECVFWLPLPDYPLSHVFTGEVAAQGAQGREAGEDLRMAEDDLWSAAFQVPLARSEWEVRASAHGRGLEYVKSGCESSDTAARFFLHVHPVQLADLPEASAGRGYTNLDFAWDRAGGAKADGGCRISVALPDFPIAFVRTGQFQDGVVARRLWSERIDFAEEARAWLRDAYAAGALARSVWGVYVDVPGRRLVYVNAPCARDWRPRGAGVGFFLHATPFTPEKLPQGRVPSGFVNLDQAVFRYLRWSEEECVFSVRLPDYPLSRVYTGQYATPALWEESTYENLWSVTLQMPLARSLWEVRASAHGRGLEYVKAPCGPSDTEARFFLHVHPARPADLPEASVGRGYANLDFAWDGAGGVVADGGCRIAATLPDFPIAFVRTGQFRGGIVTRQLWNARIDFAEGGPPTGQEPRPSDDGV